VVRTDSPLSGIRLGWPRAWLSSHEPLQPSQIELTEKAVRHGRVELERLEVEAKDALMHAARLSSKPEIETRTIVQQVSIPGERRLLWAGPWAGLSLVPPACALDSRRPRVHEALDPVGEVDVGDDETNNDD
jgi:hypothetical protein